MELAGIRKWTGLLTECGLALATGCVLALFLQWLFGEEFSTREQARVYAPIAGAEYGDGRRDDIRVLLIDDAALTAAGQVWPARYSYSARLLGAIALYKPKAVFVDVYFSALRDDPSLPALLRALCAMREQGIPLFMASARNGAGHYALRPEIDALAGKCFDKVGIEFMPDEIDRVAWNYQLTVGRNSNVAAPMDSAALALYRAVGGASVSVDQRPLALTWGSRSATRGLAWLDSASADAETYCRPSAGMGELLPPGLLNAFHGDAEKPLCVFHETLYAGELANTTPEREAGLRHEIEGKIVLIGLGTTDSGDFVHSPLHGRIPGVFLHAMALDNLLTHGEDYPRHMSLQYDRSQAPLFLFLFICMTSMVFVSRLLRPWIVRQAGEKVLSNPVEFVVSHPRLQQGRLAPLARLAVLLSIWMVRLCAILVAGYAMVWVGQHCFGLGVLSVVGIIFLTLVAEWFELNQKIRRCLAPAAKTEQSS